MAMTSAEAAKHLKGAKNRLAKWRRIVFDAVDQKQPTQDIHSHMNYVRSKEELHAAVDAVLVTGHDMDTLTLCIVIERMIEDASRDHEAKAESPIRSSVTHEARDASS